MNKTLTIENYISNNGQTVLLNVESIEIIEPTIEELIAEKEAKLLEIYSELEKLKNQE